jgi:predicted RNase H-like HicB family nuclease
MRFLVMIRRAGKGYSADVPDLPGCIAVAKSLRRVRKLIARGIELHLELMHQSGEQIPTPSGSMEFVIDPAEEEEICTWVEVSLPQFARA